MRVLIVDDHDLLRRGVKSLILASGDGVEVCGEAVDGRDAIQKALQLKPDVITMDVTMPNLNGFEATREIHRLVPECRIIMLSQHNSPETMRQALRAGASGYVVKSAISSELLKAVDAVRQGGTYFEDSVFARTSAHIDTEQVLQVVTSNMSIAVTRCTRDMRYLWANQSYSAWIQRPLRKVIGHTIVEVLGDEAFAALSGYFYRALSGERVAYEEEANFRGIGPRWVSCVYTPTLDASGTPDGWVAVVQDVTERRQTEEALRQSRAQLKAEAAALADLNNLSLRLWNKGTLQEGLYEILDASTSLMGTNKGTMQIYHAQRGVLTIEAHRGFQKSFLEVFREVAADNESACGRALRKAERIHIQDVEKDAGYAPFREVARQNGYRAVISEPLLGSDGKPLGMLSVHFREPHQPTAEAFHRFDLYARQAAYFIQRCQTEKQGASSSGVATQVEDCRSWA